MFLLYYPLVWWHKTSVLSIMEISSHFKFAYNLKELFCLSLEFLFVQKYFVFCSYKADYLFHLAGYSILYLFSDNVASVTQYS